MCFQARLKTAGAPLFANTVPTWLISKETHMLSSKLAQAGGWWGAAPLLATITACMVNGGVFKRLLLCVGGFKSDSEAVSKLAHG